MPPVTPQRALQPIDKPPENSSSTAAPGSSTPRIIVYHQTHYHNNEFVSMLPLHTEKTGTTHIILAAIHLNASSTSTSEAPFITLNDDPYTSPKYAPLLSEIHTLKTTSTIKILGLLGGAAKGSFHLLDSPQSEPGFRKVYTPLETCIRHLSLDGLDLDVEEETSLPGIIRLILALKSSFGSDFLITLAPVATALMRWGGVPGIGTRHNLSGFSYFELEKAVGSLIAWYNTQFYCGWGDMSSSEDYENIMLGVGCGIWPPPPPKEDELVGSTGMVWDVRKIVVGLVTNPRNGAGWVPDELVRDSLERCVNVFGSLDPPVEKSDGGGNVGTSFGGVMGWEYFNSMTERDGEGKPWMWARFMAEILRPEALS